MYNPAASSLVSIGSGQLSLGFCQIACYILWAILMWALFSAVKRAVGDKLLQSDAFGQFEYFLGMMGGMIRFALITLFLLAFLNAKNVTPAEIAEQKRKQLDLYGSSFFPTIGQIQQMVFIQSYTGSAVKKRLDPQLLHVSDAPAATPRSNEKSRNIDEILK